MQEHVVKTCNLSRHYGRHTAVDKLNLQLRRGEILGLLGPNGAGKSTTMQMLAGALAPSDGAIEIAGIDLIADPLAAKRHLGFLPEVPPLYMDLSVDEYLNYCARLRGLPKAARPSAVTQGKAHCGLEQLGQRLIANLSKGYQQRIGIAQAILHNPAVIILDEPTTGLDPLQIIEVRQLIRQLGQGHAIILSTHILSEAQKLCDRVLVIDRGRIILDQEIADKDDVAQTPTIKIAFKNPPHIAQLQDIKGVASVEKITEDTFIIYLTTGLEAIDSILGKALEHNWRLYKLQTQRDTLETLFTQLTLTQTKPSP